MSLASAAALLVGASVKNRIRRLVREPRQLLFLLVGAGYLFLVGGSNSMLRRSAPALIRDPSHVPPWLAFGLLVYLLVVWLVGADAAVLAFTEAEVEFFFTAPVSRRQLIQYKLVRTLLASFTSGAFFAIVLGRGGRPLFATVGFGLAFSTLALHRVCASMTRASLLEHGLSAVRRRIFTLAVAVAILVAAVVSVARDAVALPSFDPSDGGNVLAWADAASAWADSRAAGIAWLLFPVRAMMRVTWATSSAQFFGGLPAALAVLGVHYAWAMSTDVAFEEASAEAAKKTARRLEQLRAGRGGNVPRTPPLFRLTANGGPWVAIFWKNLVSGTRVPRRRLVAWVLLFVVMPLAFGSMLGHGVRSALGPILIGVAVVAAVLGPHMLQNDLREDIDQMDILRSYPVSARALVIGEIAAPLAILTAIQEGALIVAITIGAAQGSGVVCAVAAGCAAVLPPVTACLLVLRNLGALWLPSWAGASAQSIRGIEAFGQRLFVMFGTLMVLGIVMVPVGIVAGGVCLALWSILGVATLPLGGALGAVVAAAEAYVGVVIAGSVFETFDVSKR